MRSVRILSLTFACLLAVLCGAQLASALFGQDNDRADIGTYDNRLSDDGPVVEFTLSKSASPKELNVSGKLTWNAVFPDKTFVLKGRYNRETKSFKSFGEIRGEEDKFGMTLDGKYVGGNEFELKLKFIKFGKEGGDFVICNLNKQKPWGKDDAAPAPGKDKPKDDPGKKDPDAQPSRGSIKGSATMDRASADIGDTLKLNVSYSLSGREDDTVMESVALYGPDNTLMARSDKERSIGKGSPLTKSFDIKCSKGGAYTVRVRVKGELSAEWKDSATFTIKKGAEKPEKMADFSGEWSTNSGTMVLTQAGGSVKGTYTWMRGTIEGTVTGRKMKFKWSQPRNDRYGTGEFTMSSGDNSFSGTHVYTHPADAVKLAPMPWNGSRTKPGAKKDDEPEERRKTTSTTMVQTSGDDEKKQIAARIDPSSITLRAGEPSKIVNIIISGFRTNTADRVEVIFPQATDGWASLPGQIVVGGGAGHYDPANMGRPQHADGYFFSARSTAPDGQEAIEIIVRQKGAGQVRLTLDVKVIGREAAPPSQNGDPWDGQWNETGNPWSPLMLKREGNNVTGKFWGGKASLRGDIDGDTLKFTYEGYFGGKGRGELTLAADGKTLKGHYVEEGDNTKYFMSLRRG